MRLLAPAGSPPSASGPYARPKRRFDLFGRLAGLRIELGCAFIRERDHVGGQFGHPGHSLRGIQPAVFRLVVQFSQGSNNGFYGNFRAALRASLISGYLQIRASFNTVVVLIAC